MNHSSDSVEAPPFAFAVVVPGAVPERGAACVPAIIVASNGPIPAAARADTVNPGDDDDDDDDDDDKGKGGGNIDPDDDEGYGDDDDEDDDDDDDDEEPLWATGIGGPRRSPARGRPVAVTRHARPGLLRRTKAAFCLGGATAMPRCIGSPVRIGSRRRHTARPDG